MTTINSSNEIQLNNPELTPKFPLLDLDFNSLPKKNRTDKQNEDVVFFNTINGSFAVFDGMGGEANGRDSSQFCSDLIQDRLKLLSPNISPQEAVKSLKNIAMNVNQLFMENKSKFNLGGSTATFGILCQNNLGGYQAVIANMGDSRAYLFRSDNQRPLIKLTTDDNNIKAQAPNNFEKIQNKLDEVLYENQLNNTEKYLFKNRNAITNFFGYENACPEINFINLQKGDILLLTTDGVHDNLTTQEISRILLNYQNQNSTEIIKELIGQSQKRSQEGSFRSKSDDMTAMIIKVGKKP
ncbi:MAG: serine/threonine-protein phosphatase [Candidatus Shapirobacteria bacterium]|nr:serine/threonine-protein phosphatase [Candidatus Shapirobacteria bacterium]